MNQKYDYNAWKDRLDELQNWWGKRFELQLEEFFTGLPTNLNCHAGGTSDAWGTPDGKASDRGTNW